MKYMFVNYPKCTTCQKAQAWLSDAGIEFVGRDIKLQNPTHSEIELWHKLSKLPLKKFFNTSGLVYKGMGLSKRLADMSEDEQIALLASDGMLVKRPIVVGEDIVLVGFKPDEWKILK